ncbi:MAG: TolC family protein [Pirellulaceae bacterium]
MPTLPADAERLGSLASRIEYEDVHAPPIEVESGANTQAPMDLHDTLAHGNPYQYWDLRLSEAIQVTLQNAEVLRSIGGEVIRAPEAITTILDPALRATHPRQGVEAALSAYDTVFFSTLHSENNDQAFNNTFQGQGALQLKQDLINWHAGLQKQSMTGAQFTLRTSIDYDANNIGSNQFPSVWNAAYELQVRQPLLRGAGTAFNRVAGPNSLPGLYNGVLLARAYTDVALSDFEIGLRDVVSDVENAYWDLYFSYQNLEAKKNARDAAYETWQRVLALQQTGRRGGEASRVAQAKYQYLMFKKQVEEALGGPARDATRTNSGVHAGTFRGAGSVYANERALRRLMGIDVADGQLIRPMDEPLVAPLVYDWESIKCEAVRHRAELQKQRHRVRAKEMEWYASRKMLLPKLDAVGQWQLLGLGDDLLGNGARFASAYQTLGSFDFQQWQFGLQLEVPLGLRNEYSAEYNARLALMREKAVLFEQQHQIVSRLGDAVSEQNGFYELAETSRTVYEAATEELNAMQAAYEAGETTLDQVLVSQRRLADAQVDYHRNRIEYIVALKNVHYQKGTLLEYNNVILDDACYFDADGRSPYQLTQMLPGPRSKRKPVQTPDQRHMLASAPAPDQRGASDRLSRLPSE